MPGVLQLRRAAKFSRSQLAEKACIGRYKVWQFETGRADPTPVEEAALRAALLALMRERSTKFHYLLQQTN